MSERAIKLWWAWIWVWIALGGALTRSGRLTHPLRDDLPGDLAFCEKGLEKPVYRLPRAVLTCLKDMGWRYEK